MFSDVRTDDSDVTKSTGCGASVPKKVVPQGQLRGILRKSSGCESEERKGATVHQVSQRVSANQARRITEKLQKQLALNDEISMLLEETKLETTCSKEGSETEALQRMIADLRDAHRRMMEAHSQLVACASS